MLVDMTVVGYEAVKFIGVCVLGFALGYIAGYAFR
jgi:hypothetical protein